MTAPLLTLIENAIVAQLQSLRSAARIKALPSTAEAAGEVWGLGNIYVVFTGATYEPPNFVEPYLQLEKNYTFEIRLTSNEYRTHQECYPIMEAIHKLLTGHRPHIEGCLEAGRKLMPTRDRFVELEEGFWQYAIGYSIQLPVWEDDLANTAPGDEPLSTGKLEVGIHRSQVEVLPRDLQQSVLDREFIVETPNNA